MILSSKHTPCLNNFAEQNRNKHFVCFSSQKLPYGGASVFVYGVRVPTTQNNKNSEADKYLLRYFWYAGRDFVKTHSVIKAKCKHLPTITSYVSPLPTKSRTLRGPRNQEGVLRNPTRHNKKPKADKSTLDFLVRRKGLEPPTYWFVASHSIQLSYRRICNRSSLLLKYYNILQSKMQAFFDYYLIII